MSKSARRPARPARGTRCCSRASRNGFTVTAAAFITVRNLTKRFGAFTAVDRVSFEVADGHTLALLGRERTLARLDRALAHIG